MTLNCSWKCVNNFSVDLFIQQVLVYTCWPFYMRKKTITRNNLTIIIYVICFTIILTSNSQFKKRWMNSLMKNMKMLVPIATG